jgi:hypothetical protein
MPPDISLLKSPPSGGFFYWLYINNNGGIYIPAAVVPAFLCFPEPIIRHAVNYNRQNP